MNEQQMLCNSQFIIEHGISNVDPIKKIAVPGCEDMRYNLISVLPGYPPRFGRQLFPRFGQFFQTRKMKLAETCRGGINFV